MPDAVSPAHVALGRAIRQIREEHGLAQEQVALAAGLARSHFGRIERGEQNLTYSGLLVVAHALAVTGSALVARAEEIAPDARGPSPRKRPRLRPGAT